MSQGKLCPDCGKDIGLRALLGESPYRIRCPHCRKRLAYADITLLFVGGIVIYLLVLTICTAFAIYFDDGLEHYFGPYGMLMPIGTCLVAYILLDIGGSMYVRKYHRLIIAGRPMWSGDLEEFAEN